MQATRIKIRSSRLAAATFGVLMLLGCVGCHTTGAPLAKNAYSETEYFQALNQPKKQDAPDDVVDAVGWGLYFASPFVFH